MKGVLSASSTMDENTETQVDPQAGEQHVKELWKILGIGENGYLTVSELGTVCRHIGMDEMQDWEVHQLFDQLDADGDGQVTFDEFLSEMFQHSTPSIDDTESTMPSSPPSSSSYHLPSASSQTASPQVPRTKSRRRRSFVRKTGMPQHESFFLSQGNASLSFTTLDVNNRGRIKGDELVELWESYGIPNAMEILKAYGLQPDRELSHAKLAAVLEDELLFTADHTPKLLAAIITSLQECKNLRCLLEQASAERDRLIVGLRESNIRSQILAEEDDERHAALEKTLQTKVLSMEGVYQEQIKTLKEELKKEREERMDIMEEHDLIVEKMTTSYREENKKLKEDLTTTQEDLRQAQIELNEVRERVKDLERQKHKLQYQLSVEKLKSGGKTLSEQWDLFQATNDSHNMMRQQIALLQDENKHLGDRLEELSPQCRKINHRTTDRRKHLSRSMSLREQSLSEVFPVSNMDILQRSSGSSVDLDEFNQMQRELKQLKKNMEIEHKEIEHAYLIEIAQIEERHNYEMSETIKQTKREKEKILEDRAKRQQEALAKLEKDLQTQFAMEKQDLLLKHETEKNLLEQKLAEDKIRLTERLRFEYLDDLHRKTRQMEISMAGECQPWQVAPGPPHATNEKGSVEAVRGPVSPPPASDNVPSRPVTNSGNHELPNNDGSPGGRNQPWPTAANPSFIQPVGSQQALQQQQQPRDGGVEKSNTGYGPQRKGSNNSFAESRRRSYQSAPAANPTFTTEMTGGLPDIYEEIALVSSQHSSTASAEYQWTGRQAGGGDVGDGDCKVLDGGSGENGAVASNMSKKDQLDGKRLVIQLCCMEELHKVDGSKLQKLFEKDMESNLRGEFIKALMKYRDEEMSRLNAAENDNSSISDASDNISRPRNLPSSPSSTSSTSSSSVSESQKSKDSFRFRNKHLNIDADKRHIIQCYEDKLKSKEREIQRLKRRVMNQSEPNPPKEYSVKSAVTNLGYQLLFPRQKQNKATQTEQRRHLHRNMSDLHLKCFYQEEKLQNLEKELTHREEQTHSVMKNVEETYRNVIHNIEEEREQLKHQLISATEALQDQSGRLQEQQSKSMNRDLLLKDLYLQNAELMRSLQQMEEQLRTADQKNLQLEEKCRVLDKVLQKARYEGSPKEPPVLKISGAECPKRKTITVQEVINVGLRCTSSEEDTSGDVAEAHLCFNNSEDDTSGDTDVAEADLFCNSSKDGTSGDTDVAEADLFCNSSKDGTSGDTDVAEADLFCNSSKDDASADTDVAEADLFCNSSKDGTSADTDVAEADLFCNSSKDGTSADTDVAKTDLFCSSSKDGTSGDTDVAEADLFCDSSKDDTSGDGDMALMTDRNDNDSERCSMVTIISFTDGEFSLCKDSPAKKYRSVCVQDSGSLKWAKDKEKPHLPSADDFQVKNPYETISKAAEECSVDFNKHVGEITPGTSSHRLHKGGFVASEDAFLNNSGVPNEDRESLLIGDDAGKTNSCDDIDDPSFAENLGDDSNATELDGYDFTDEEEDIFFDTIGGVDFSEKDTENENGNTSSCATNYRGDVVENVMQFNFETKDGLNKDMVGTDYDEAEEVRLEFLSELEEKYIQVRQLVLLVKDSEIKRTLIKIVRWILQTHQRLQR